MTFWIISSIMLFLIVIVSVFGPYLGLYGNAKSEARKYELEDSGKAERV